MIQLKQTNILGGLESSKRPKMAGGFGLYQFRAFDDGQPYSGSINIIGSSATSFNNIVLKSGSDIEVQVKKASVEIQTRAWSSGDYNFRFRIGNPSIFFQTAYKSITELASCTNPNDNNKLSILNKGYINSLGSVYQVILDADDPTVVTECASSKWEIVALMKIRESDILDLSFNSNYKTEFKKIA